jgi:hypothetical protein
MRNLFGILLLGGVLCAQSAQAADLPALDVIPAPREAVLNGAGFDPSTASVVAVSDNAEDRFAARGLAASLRTTHGIDCPITLLPQGTNSPHQVWVGSAAQLLSIAEVAEPEGYALAVSSNGVLIRAHDDAGLFYGVQTLIQLLEQARRDHAPIPGWTLRDWPAFAWRARYFDASQYFGSIVATRKNLEHEIAQLARYKLNWLCFDAYNFVPFKSFPACANANTLSLADWNDLVELAHRYHVTLVPSLQSFAQMYDVIWNCDAGKPYRESTAPGLICPSRPENIRFLQGLYGDLISVFKYSPVLGIGCSETSMQWGTNYCPLCRDRINHGETYEQIFCKHVRDCVEAVELAGKQSGRMVRPMMWGDEFYMGYNGKRWTGIEMIPTNTVMGHWMYWPSYEYMGGLLERGFDVFFLSATYQHNIFLVDLSPQTPADGKWPPLLDSGVRNIADQARQAAADNEKNFHGKVIGGGCATFSQHDIRCWDTTWLAYLLESEYSWGKPTGADDAFLDHFIDKFAGVYYQARTPEAARLIASAYRDLDAVKSDIERNNYLIRDILGVYDIQDNCYTGNTLSNSLKLIDALAAHPPRAGKNVEDIRQRCHDALRQTAAYRSKLPKILTEVDNVESLQFLISAPHKMENHVKRTLLLLDVADAFRKMESAKDAPVREALGGTLPGLEKRCAELKADTRLLTDEVEDLTRTGGADSYRQALMQLDELQVRLVATRKAKIGAGAP